MNFSFGLPFIMICIKNPCKDNKKKNIPTIQQYKNVIFALQFTETEQDDGIQNIYL